jgi:hypothetical protein
VTAVQTAELLDVDTARAATDRLRLTLTDAHEQLIELFRRRAHEALGYGKGTAGWTAYCAAEFGELLHVKPTGEQLAAMVDAGLSQRQAAAPFAVSLGTVNAALQSRRAGPAGAPPPPAAPVRRRELTARIVDLLAEAGPLDVLAVAKRLRVRQAQVSPALCRLAAAGRITYRPPARRGLMGVYVVEAGAL